MAKLNNTKKSGKNVADDKERLASEIAARYDPNSATYKYRDKTPYQSLREKNEISTIPRTYESQRYSRSTPEGSAYRQNQSPTLTTEDYRNAANAYVTNSRRQRPQPPQSRNPRSSYYNPNWQKELTERRQAEKASVQMGKDKLAAERKQRLQERDNEIAGYGKYFSASDFKSGVAVGQHKYEAANKRERESTPGFWDIFNGAMGSGDAIITSKQAEDFQRADTIASVDAMTDDERDIYYYLLGTRGDSEAEKFRSLLQESLNYRIGTKEAGLNKKVGTAGILPFVAGVDNAFAGMTNAISGVFDGPMVPTSPLQYEYKAWREGLNPVRGAINDVAYTGGNMLPSIAASAALGGLDVPSKLASALGASTLGVSAGGNAYKEGRDSGYTHKQALTYGTLVGASEAGLQAVLGGISSLGLGITEEAAGGAISRALGKVIKNTGVTDAIGRYIANMGSEATEEYLQSLLEPVFKNVVAGEQNEFNPLDEEALYSGLMGALTAGLFEAPNLALDIGVARYAEREFNAALNSMQRESTAAQSVQEQSPVDIQRKAAQGVAGNEVEPPAAVNRTPANEDINRVAEAAAKAAQTQPPTNIQEAAAQAAEKAAQRPLERQTSNNAAAPAKTAQNGVATRHTATTSNGNAVSVGSIVDTDNGLNVRLSDGTTAQLSDVDFDDPNINVLYERAASFDANTANALVNNYTGETSVDNYLRGFNSVYLSGKQGYEYAKAVGDSVYARHYLNDNARMAAFRAGQAAYQSSRANSIAGQQGNNVRPQAKAEYEAGVNREYSDQKLTSSQRKQIRALDEVFKAAGKKLVIHDAIGTDGNSVTFSRSDANAYYDAKTDTYHLSLDSTGQAYAYVVAHESIHEMEVKNKEGFSALSEVVEAAIEGELMNQKGMTFDEAKAEFEKMVQYQIDKNGLSRSEAVTEVVANTVPVILTDEQQGKRFADKVMKSSGKVRAWFEQLIKDLRAILDKAYNILKGQKSWEQMELIRNNKQTLDMIADYYFEGMEGTKGKAANEDGKVSFSPRLDPNFGSSVDIEKNYRAVANMQPVAKVKGTEFAKGEVDLITQVSNFFEEIGGEVISPDLGRIILDRNGVKDDIAHGIGRNKAAAFVAVPDVIKKGKILDVQYNWKGRGYDTVIVAAPVVFSGQNAVEGVILRKKSINDDFYLHEIKIEGVSTFKTGANKIGAPSADTPSVISILQKVFDYKEKSDGNVKLSAKDSGADIREVNPMEITPPNRVTSSSKYHYLINEFENNGYNGRRVVLVENGNDGYQALTGSHRILAAREAGVDVPSVVIPMSEEIQPLLDATGDEERARIADELYEDGIIPKEARDLLVREDELNFENLGKPLDKQVRFSMKNAVEESQQFKRWFGDWQNNPAKASKVVNADGTPKVMYRGGNETFNIFDRKKSKYSNLYGRGFYFTDSESHARQYGDARAYYLDVKHPVPMQERTITKKQMRNFLEAVAENEDYGLENYGSGATVDSVLKDVYGKNDFAMLNDVNQTAIGDMVAAVELFNEVNGTDFDGLILDTETVVFNSNQIKSATDNIGTFDPNNPDIRFSMKDTVEETRDLIAVHNLKGAELEADIELGGFPMPSIAITKPELGHSEFGDISLIFGKDTIDPKRSGNKVYNADAYTPTFPQIGYKPNEKSIKRLRDLYYKVYEKAGSDIAYPLYAFGVDDAGEAIARYGGSEQAIVKSFADNTDMMQAYLVDQGKQPIETIQREVVTEIGEPEKERYDFILNKLGKDAFEAMGTGKSRATWYEKYGESYREALKQQLIDAGIDSEAAASVVADGFSRGDVLTDALKVRSYMQNGPRMVRTQPDIAATQKAIKEAVNPSEYKAWLENTFSGIVSKKGIRNDKDTFTNSGNRRSFETLYWEFNLENIVKAMKSQDEKGASGLGTKSIFGSSAREYESIADIKADSSRLQTLNEEQYAAIKETYSNRFREIVDTYAGNKDWWDAANTLCEAVALRKTRTGIYNYLNQWPQVYKASYDIVDSLISLTQDIAKMPTEYFEAKPQRAVSFDEVRAVIMPEGKYEDLQTALESRGIPVETYNPDVEGERLSKLNSEFTERFRFSRKDDVSVTSEDAKKLQKQNDKLKQALEVAKQEIKLSDGHHVKASAVERLAGSLLKEYSSKMDKAELVSNITELFDYIGNGENVVWDEVQAGAMNIALNVLDQSSKRNTEWYDNTKPAREFLKNNTIKLNEKQLAEVQSAFGSYTEFRRELYNKAKFSKTEGISLEQAWRDLSSMFPDTFDPDTPDVDMPTLLHDEVLNMYDRPIENPYGYDMKGYASDLAMRLYGEYMAMPERKTFADKQQKKLEMQRARYNTLMEQQREQAKAKYERLRDQRDITKYKTSIEKNAKSLYSWLTKPNNSKHVPEALRNKTADLLKTLEFDGKKGYMWKDAMRNLQTWMQQVDRAKTNPDIDNPLIEYAPDLIDNMQSLLDSASKYNNISEMPLDKLKELNNIVAAVKHTVTTANTVIADGRRQYIDDIGGNIIKTAQVQRPKAREFMRKHPYAYKMASAVSGFFISGNVKPIYFFDNIGGEMKTLFNDVRQASYKAALTANAIREEYAQIKDKYRYKEWADKSGDLLTIQTKGGSNVSITREQALDIYATAKREKLIGTQHLTKDGFVFNKDVVQKNGKLIETATNDNVNKPLSEETIAEISDWLTKEQKGYADALVELMSTKGAELGNEVTMLMYGINRFAESYYIPIMSAQQFIETAFNGRVSEAMTWMNKGFTKNTVAGARNPIVITGITQKALQHMADMATYNAMAIPQDTMAKVYNYKQRGEDGGANTYIRAELDKAYGQHTSKYIKTFINDISGNITVDPRDSMASKMISAFRRNAISGKLSVAIQQPSAIVRATALVDPKYFFGHVSKNTYDTAKKYSGTAVIKEVGGFDAYTGKGLVQWMADNNKLNFRNVRDAVAGWAPQKMDEITWCRIWKACENEIADTTAFERGSEEFYKAVGHRFDDVIEYTQVYDSVISRSEYMRSKSAGAKLFTSFKAEPTVSYNMYWYALKHMDEKGGKARLLRTAASIIGAGVFNAILKSVITAIRDDDENQNYVDKYVEALVGNLVGTPLKKVPYIGEYIYLGGELDTLGSLPLVNEVLSMLQGYTSSRSELKVIQDLINAAGDLDNEKKGLDERLLRMAKATSQMFGIPLDAFIKDWLGVVKEAYKAISGNEPELSGNIMYEIREGLGVKQELELYKGVDKAITTGDYTRLDKQFKTMVERDTTTDPTKKARETVRAAVRQYFDAGEVKAGDAKRILVRCGYKMDDAEAMITKWDFWRDYPEAHDTSIEDGTETLAAKYFEYAKPANIDKTLFYDVYKFNGSAKADKDKNGNSIRNSKRDKVADYINKQRLTKAQKDALWLACGYKESTLDEAPWR